MVVVFLDDDLPPMAGQEASVSYYQGDFSLLDTDGLINAPFTVPEMILDLSNRKIPSDVRKQAWREYFLKYDTTNKNICYFGDDARFSDQFLKYIESLHDDFLTNWRTCNQKKIGVGKHEHV